MSYASFHKELTITLSKPLASFDLNSKDGVSKDARRIVQNISRCDDLFAGEETQG